MESVANRLVRVFLIFSVVLWSLEIRIPEDFSVREGAMIERVVYGDGKGSEVILPVKEETFYRGRYPAMHFKKFRKYSSKYGDFYLIDLSRDGKFFDALGYDTLEVHAQVDRFRVALADQKLAGRETNRIVGVDRHHISLFPGIKGLDLQRLKYVVIFANSPLEKLEIVFRKRQSSMLRRSQKGLSVWAWTPKSVKTARLKKAGITQVYLQIGDGFTSVSQQLHRQGIRLYALDGSPDDINHPQALLKKFSRLPRESYDGIQLDVEPYLLDDFSKDRERVLRRYLDLLDSAAHWSHRHGVPLSVVIPFWFDNLRYAGKSFLPQVLQRVDEIVLMSYRSDPDEVFSISADTLRWGEVLGKTISIGAELKPVETEKHFRYRVGPSGPCLTQRFFHLKCHSLDFVSEYTVTGESISYFYRPQRLKKLLGYRSLYRSFGGFVLHDESMLDRFETVIEKKCVDINRMTSLR